MGYRLAETLTITYSNVQSGYPGKGNIQINPVFKSLEDYHIDCLISPCMDAGNNDAPNLPDIDIDGQSRIICDKVGMGADECPNCTPPEPPQFAISPPSGYYVATQGVDLTLVIGPSDLSVGLISFFLKHDVSFRGIHYQYS